MNQAINDKLKQPIAIDRVKKRKGGGGTLLSYIETHDAIAALNHIFGFDGWSFELLQFESFATANGSIYRQTVRLTVQIDDLRIVREDVGIGVASNGNADQLEKGMKEAASDGLKRAARTLGEQFGNSLYEKDAPEHDGKQRAGLATSVQLAECEALRLKAVQLGFLTSQNVKPKAQVEGAEESPVLARIAAYRKYIQENGDKAQDALAPETAPINQKTRFEALREKFVSSVAYGEFEAALDEMGISFENDADLIAFEDAASRTLDMPIIAENQSENDWKETTGHVKSGRLRWPI